MNLSTSEDRATKSTTVEETRKFLFDLSFDDEVALALPQVEKAKPTFSEEDLEAAKKESYDSGFAAGKNAMLESQQQQMNLMLTNMETKLKDVLDQAHNNHAQQLGQMREIALVIMRKMMPAYVEKYGLDEVETIVTRTITEINQEPRLVIRVSESQFDLASEHINQLADNQAFAGKLVILGDPELATSDCRIEWADGGIERDHRRIWHEIDKALGMADSSQAEGPTAPPEDDAAPPEDDAAAPEDDAAAPETAPEEMAAATTEAPATEAQETETQPEDVTTDQVEPAPDSTIDSSAAPTDTSEPVAEPQETIPPEEGDKP